MTDKRKFLAAGVAVLFVLFLSSVSIAQEEEYTLKGRVVSVDYLAQKLTVQSVDKIPSLVSGTLGQFTFSMNAITKVTMCDQVKPIEDIKIGQEITVSYHERGGKLYADSIAIPTPLLACLVE